MVRCADCGFLAARNLNTRELDEAEESFRQDGTFPPINDEKGHNPHAGWESAPVCFIQHYDLREEIKQQGLNDKEKYSGVHSVINKDRECKSFTKWRQGSTPKEHREMMDRQEWSNWQEKQRNDDKRWRIIELVVLVIGAGLFTLLGAWIASPK